MVQPVISKQRLLTVRDLFEDVPHGAPPLQLTLEGVPARLAAIESLDKEVSATEVRWARKLMEATGYCLRRFRDSIARRTFLEWLRKTFATLSGDEQHPWRQFSSLAVKDFHADVVSAMDAAAVVVILIDGQLNEKDETRLPGFAAICKKSKRSYRKGLSDSQKELVDAATDDWFDFVKGIRNTLIHRKHTPCIFFGPEEGFFYQLSSDSDSQDEPMVTNPALLKAGNTNIVDFELYSAWVLAEMAYFLEALGCLIGERLGSFEEHLPGCYGRVRRQRVCLLLGWPSLPADLDRILCRLNDNQARHSSESLA